MAKKYQQKEVVKVINVGESLGKLPPQAVDLEEAILGAIMLERDAMSSVIEFLKPEHFYIDAHKEIYQAAIEMFGNAEPIDLRTMVNHLRKTGKIDLVGGAFYIAELTSKVSSASNIEYHARVVIEFSIRRSLITIGGETINDAYDDTVDVFDLMNKCQKNIDSIVSGNIKGAPITSMIVYSNAVKKLVSSKNESGITGVPSGYKLLDRLTGGWQNSDLIILAGRPSMGKTAFVTNLVRNASIMFNLPVAFFSLEMSSLQLMNRMIASESEVELDRIMKGNYSSEDWKRIEYKSAPLSKAKIFIDDTASLSTLELRAKCRRLKIKHNIKLIVVDYLQLMKGEGNGNREQEISNISRTLKGIAKELDVPVIALAQLSRGVETRGGDKMPMLADLRESGAIEQDADIVMFVYRAEYYKIPTYADGTSTAGKMDVIIAKHRNGSLDTIQLKFNGRYQKVSEIELDSFSSVQPPPNFKPLTSVLNYRDVSQSENNNKDDDLPF